MLKIIQKSFNILRNNTLFVQPLLMFLLTVLSVMLFLNGRTLLFPARITLLVSLILMFIAFCSGWFYIIKQGILSYNENDSKAEITEKSIANFKKFFEGIGGNFLRLLFTFLLLFVVYIGIITVVSKLCLTLFGLPEIYNDIQKINMAASPAERLNIINSIPIQNQIVFMQWIALLYPVSVVLNFFVILASAAVYFEKVNIIIAFFKAIKFFIMNIFGCILAIVVLQIIYIAINIISMLLGINAISLFVSTMLITIYLNYFIILVFCLYNDRTNNNSNNRTEFIG